MDIAHLLIQSISCEKAQGDKSKEAFGLLEQSTE